MVSFLHCSMRSGLSQPPLLTEGTTRSLSVLQPAIFKGQLKTISGIRTLPPSNSVEIDPQVQKFLGKIQACTCMWMWQSINIISSGTSQELPLLHEGFFFTALQYSGHIPFARHSIHIDLTTQLGESARSSNQPGLGQGMLREKVMFLICN